MSGTRAASIPGKSKSASIWRRILSTFAEIGFLLGLLSLYKAGRLAAMHHTHNAWLNARWAHKIDTLLSRPSTPWLQEHLSDRVLHAANVYYASVHFPLTAAFVASCLFSLERSAYLRMRNTLVTMTFIALVVEIAIPLAPPRMFPQWGYQDTMNTIGPSAYAGHVGKVANQLAAMPSLHVGWASLIALTLWRSAPRWIGALGVGHAMATITVVTITANHWRIDGIVALIVLFATDRAFGKRCRDGVAPAESPVTSPT